MRLISCYIENFGGLSRYSCQFDPGLTQIQAPNGFGKTTLAEFIRTMFYGFPRANKALEKNRRKKYLPWQGGKCGGNLVFEYQDIQYRVERTFGEKPSSDTFALYDQATGRRSSRFTEDIGAELFQLDADSFARSTYLPQLREDTESLSTDSIQAKLGNLVEDTNDVNNFEKATRALREKRSALIPYRGSGGSVARARENVSKLEESLERDRGQYEALEALRTEAAALRTELEGRERAREDVLERLSRVSEAAGRAALAERLAQMRGDEERCQAALTDLRARYPRGLPPREAAETLLETYDAAAPLLARPETLPAYEAAKERLAELAPRLAAGIPAEETFAAWRQTCSDWAEARTALRGAAPSPEDEARLTELEAFFAPGVPEEEALNQYRETLRRMDTLRTGAAGQALPRGDAERLAALEDFFTPGLPTEEELARQSEDLSRVQALRKENQAIAAAVTAPAAESAPPKGSRAFLPVLLLGLAAAAAGIVLLGGRSYAPGGGLLGLGALLLIGAAYLRLRDMIAREVARPGWSAPMKDADRQRMRENEEALRRLEASLADFTGRYLPGGRGPAEDLPEIRSRRGEYLSLRTRAKNLAEEQKQLEQELARAETWLGEQLRPYFGAQIPADAVETLSWRRREYQTLLDKRAAAGRAQEALTARAEALEREIAAFLAPYCGAAAPEEFSTRLAALERDCVQARQSERLVSDYEAKLAEREAALERCREAVRAFSERYGLELTLTDRRAAQEVLADAARYPILEAESRQRAEAARAFYAKNRAVLDAPAPEETGDAEALKEEKRRLDEEISGLARTLTEREQAIRNLQAVVDRIPEQEDELERWRERLAEESRSAELLNVTIDLLGQAKERLSTSYLGPIRERFTDYLDRLTGEDTAAVSVDAGLTVKLDRLGQVRELGYFSAGQADLVRFCMRLALADALFQEEKPFLILDDPFANLDDQNTAGALALLRDLAQDHQVIYLVCSSSRSA